jgi:hypothetical protein
VTLIAIAIVLVCHFDGTADNFLPDDLLPKAVIFFVLVWWFARSTVRLILARVDNDKSTKRIGFFTMAIPSMVLVAWLAVLCDLPVRIGFWLSRESFEFVRDGGYAPKRRGLYYVYKIEHPYPGQTLFVLGNNGFVDPNWYGFVHAKVIPTELKPTIQLAPEWYWIGSYFPGEGKSF